MADRVSASITLGGKISPVQFATLLPLIALNDLRMEWDGEPFTPEQLPDDGPLCLFAHDVPWGNFDALEQYCCDQHISYVRWSGSCPGSFGAERIVYDGKSGPFNFSVDKDDQLVLHAETITRLGSMCAIPGTRGQSPWRSSYPRNSGVSRPQPPRGTNNGTLARRDAGARRAATAAAQWQGRQRPRDQDRGKSACGSARKRRTLRSAQRGTKCDLKPLPLIPTTLPIVTRMGRDYRPRPRQRIERVAQRAAPRVLPTVVSGTPL